MAPAPDGPGADALAAQFAIIRGRFLAGLPPRQHEIRAAVQSADAAALHAALHRLAGAAGGFGFTALGDRARTALALIGHGGGFGDPALDGALRALDDEIARLGRE